MRSGTLEIREERKAGWKGGEAGQMGRGREGRAWEAKESIEMEGGGSDDPEGGSEVGEECMGGGGEKVGHGW